MKITIEYSQNEIYEVKFLATAEFIDAFRDFDIPQENVQPLAEFATQLYLDSKVDILDAFVNAFIYYQEEIEELDGEALDQELVDYIIEFAQTAPF